MNQTRLSFLLAFLFFAGTMTLANNPQQDYLQKRIKQHNFDQQKWKSITGDIDYSKDIKEKQKPKPEKEPQSDDGLATLAKILIVLTGIALLGWMFFIMADSNELFGPKDKKLKPATANINLEKIEADLQNADLDDPIRQATAAGDYSMAVRLHYLAVLKELSLKKHIRWKKEKTNGEYLRELSGSALHDPVREVTLIFERVWYGKMLPGKEDFIQLETKFKTTVAAI